MASRPDSPLLIFDAGPLETFAAAGDPAWHAFWGRYGQRARWTDAVRDEVEGRIRRGRPWLTRVRTTLGASAIDLSADASQTEIDAVRERIRRENDPSTFHVGEAATIVAAAHLGAVAVIDDADAYTVAKALGLQVVRGLDLLDAIVRSDGLSCQDAWEAYGRMRAHSRLPVRQRWELCPPACGRHGRPVG